MGMPLLASKCRPAAHEHGEDLPAEPERGPAEPGAAGGRCHAVDADELIDQVGEAILRAERGSAGRRWYVHGAHGTAGHRQRAVRPAATVADVPDGPARRQRALPEERDHDALAGTGRSAVRADAYAARGPP